MTATDSRVTIHMVASLDGFIARKDGTVDWLETSDVYEAGRQLSEEEVRAFLDGIDCYVLGARTYETALQLGWPYGETPVVVLTHRDLPKDRESIEFHSGDLEQLVNERLRPRFRNIWFVGGGAVAGECLRRGLADEVRYTIAPILLGEGIDFFDRIGKDVPLHLMEVSADRSAYVALRYEVRKS